MRFAVLVCLLAIASDARADAWHEGRDGKRRVKHLAASALGGAVYAASETILKSTLAPDHCRICGTREFDVDIRHFRWSNTAAASTVSNLTGFVLAPALGLALLAIASDDHSLPTWIDDAIPVIESVVISGLINQGVKFAAGEQRPFVHFGDPARPPETDDNLSLFSGHTTLTFAVATSAGEVARRRGYKLAPVIYGTGYLVGITTGYLRIAADKHYFSDVAIGAAVGTAIGFIIPALHNHHVEFHPLPGGLAVAGSF